MKDLEKIILDNKDIIMARNGVMYKIFEIYQKESPILDLEYRNKFEQLQIKLFQDFVRYENEIQQYK